MEHAVYDRSSPSRQMSPAEALDLSPTRARVNLSHLRHNARQLQSRAGHAEIMAVIKANAYGHGAVPVARALEQEGIRRFAVATVPEGAALRQSGIESTIMVFGAPMAEALPAYRDLDLEITVPSLEVVDQVVSASRKLGPLAVHLKVDTGMGRIGMKPSEVGEAIRRLEAARAARIVGLWTHFAMADEEQETFTAEQIETFKSVVEAHGSAAEFIHMANSAALLRYSDSYLPFERVLVRTGISLYGLLNLPLIAAAAGLQPVMQFTARVSYVKEVPPGASVSYGRRWVAPTRRRIATVAAGYADGFPRMLTNRAEVGIGGVRYPQVGSVCMDMFMVDLGEPGGPGEDITVGDEVVLFGEGGPAVNEVALWAETIPYEICCGVSARVPREYLDGDSPAHVS